MIEKIEYEIMIFFIKLIFFIFFLIISYFICKLISRTITSKIVDKYVIDENLSYENGTTRFIENSFFIIGMILFVYVGFLILGVKSVLILTPIAIGFGFGLEEVLKNLLGGILFLNLKHVKVGDTIQIKLDKKRNYFGKIIEVNTKMTILQVPGGRKVLLPNSVFITTPIKTYSTEEIIRQEIQFELNYNFDKSRIEQIADEILSTQTFVIEKDSTRINFERVGDRGIILSLTYYSKPKSCLLNRNKLKKLLVERFRSEGIMLAYPKKIMTLEDTLKHLNQII